MGGGVHQLFSGGTRRKQEQYKENGKRNPERRSPHRPEGGNFGLTDRMGGKTAVPGGLHCGGCGPDPWMVLHLACHRHDVFRQRGL